MGQDVNTSLGSIHPTRRRENEAFKTCGNSVYDRQADVCAVLVQVLKENVHPVAARRPDLPEDPRREEVPLIKKLQTCGK